MIYEFALEPELVAQWGQRANYKRFMEKFGLNQRRLVSRFPKRWRNMVWEAFKQLEGTTFGDRKRTEELLNHLATRMTRRQAPVEDSWMEAVEREHQARRFHLIVAAQNPRDIDDVLLGVDVDQLYDGLQELPHMVSVNRTPDQMSAALAPILKCAGHIAFIDPHFDAGRQRFLQTFERYFEAIFLGRCGPDNLKVELHTSIERSFYAGEERTAVEEKRVAEDIFRLCRQKLPGIIPEGLTLRVVAWKERPGGVQLHNRYVLTDIGSVRFGHGLDCYNGQDIQTEEEGCPDDEITCLTEEVHKIRWNHYLGNPAAFDLVAEDSTIVGQKSLV